MSRLKAILLAAGRGSRMKGLTSESPKCLVPVQGRPLLEWQLQALRGAGLTDIGIVRGYKKELVAPSGVTFWDNDDWEKTNMLLSLARARDWLTRFDCVVCYSDILFSSGTIRLLERATTDIALPFNTGWRKHWEKRFADPLGDAETFRRSADGALVDIGGKARSLEEIEGQYMGILRFTPAGWKIVEDYLAGLEWEQKRRLDMTGLIRNLISKTRINTIPVTDPWFEVDNEKDLEIAEREFNPNFSS